MKLTPRGVCVLWEWEWIEDMELFEPSEPSIESQEDSDHDSDSTDSEVPPSCVATIPITHTVIHTVTFKCIGTVRSPAYQNTLKKCVSYVQRNMNRRTPLTQRQLPLDVRLVMNGIL